MKQRLFLFCFVLILLFSFILRVISLRNSNFYFTMDQGRTAVYIRDMLVRGNIPLVGPQTSIDGFYNGPGWFWFTAVGFILSNGHPVGGVLMMIFLNLTLVALLMWVIARKISPSAALIVGISLQFVWSFYDTSRYSFNPFPLVTFALTLVLLLIAFIEGNSKAFVLATIPLGLTLHTELASFPPLFILYVLIALWGLIKKKVSLQMFVGAVLLFFIFFIPHAITEWQTNFSQAKAIQKHLTHSDNFFAGTNFPEVTREFLELIEDSIIPQHHFLAIIFAVIAGLVSLKYYSIKEKSLLFISRFVVLSVLLTIISWLFFSSNRGWHSWHTVYIPPLLFIAILLMILRLPKTTSFLFYTVLMISQSLFFVQEYRHFSSPNDDPSLLVNELKAIDWIYEQSKDNGFYVYSYLPSVYDYPYQYLFWWYGRKQYGYIPCEYTTYPDTPDFFVPGYQYYQEPKRQCTNLRFLIVEPDEHEELRQRWLVGVRKGTELLGQINVGKILIEKRQIQ